jgi:hypothetical protein
VKRLASLSSTKHARSKSRRKAGVVLGLLVGGFIAIVTACSNQAEGERCDFENGNDDCQEGLVCVESRELVQGVNQGDRCCPVDRTKATHPACKIGATIGTDATPPPDTGPAPTSDAATSDADAQTTDAEEPTDAADAADTADQ